MKEGGKFCTKGHTKKALKQYHQKVSVNFGREVNISKKQVVANSILHSEKTTDIHYATRNLQIAAAKGSQLVRGVFNQSSAAPGVSPAASS